LVYGKGLWVACTVQCLYEAQINGNHLKVPSTLRLEKTSITSTLFSKFNVLYFIDLLFTKERLDVCNYKISTYSTVFSMIEFYREIFERSRTGLMQQQSFNKLRQYLQHQISGEHYNTCHTYHFAEKKLMFPLFNIWYFYQFWVALNSFNIWKVSSVQLIT